MDTATLQRATIVTLAICALAPHGMGQAKESPVRRGLDSGHVFIDGLYLPPPYEIMPVASGVSINGHTVTVQAQRLQRRAGRGLWADDRSADGPTAERAGRHFGSLPANANWSGDTRAELHANWLASALRQDSIVVVFGNSTPTVLRTLLEKSDFCSALLAEAPSGELTDKFLQLPAHVNDQQQWAAMLTNFKPDGPLRDWMQARTAEAESIATANARQVDAVRRLAGAGYPLTLLGMVLGVFALGHNLKWSAHTGPEDQAVRFLNVALLLILAMSALDLTWTILSFQAGQMRELNPLASQLIDSPPKLIVFKLIATLAACGILYRLRSNPKVQRATWWVCLICMLMTFRWVVFNSLLT